MPTPHPIVSQLFSSPRLRHGFFTRCGGVSGSIYASLNCAYSSGDEVAHVRENRSRVATTLGLDEVVLISPRQAHTKTVVVVDGPWPSDPPVADGLVTNTPGVGLSVLGADCAPVLFADVEAGVVGVCHAGWKGALEGILQSTVNRMLGLGARRSALMACIGPAIQQGSYEVGPEFRERFLGHSDTHQVFFAAGRADRYQFDLPRFIGHQLALVGVQATERLDFDTGADEDRFFSYRRATLQGETDYGCQISAIALV